MEAYVEEDTRVSVSDVGRVLGGVRAGKAREQVSPRLLQVGADVSGEGLTVEVRFVKRDGLPVQFVQADAAVDASAVRVVDLTRKYNRGATELATALGLSAHQGAGPAPAPGPRQRRRVPAHLRVRVVQTRGLLGQSPHSLREALDAGTDMAAVWKAHPPTRGSAAPAACSQPGCAAVAKAS